ncbi:hypothetical protein BD779DRAFT_676403 [Infundibulicybe gibba]|nr:hypothetical protein BD779DRAFT_676403 [Infundibulicybe gibba]
MSTSTELRRISLAEISPSGPFPAPKIQTDDDLARWRTTQSYRDYQLFLRRLNESVIGYSLPWHPESQSEGTLKLIQLLEELDGWIEEIPPHDTPQRFGNLAFRTWGKRLEEHAGKLLEGLLPPTHYVAIPYLKPYLLVSFGSFTRLDYGTGHETSFALFLLSLTLIRFLHPDRDEERNIVLCVFLRYLRLCWKLQDVYKLEPAGSHGVWGLDDYSFLGYIFGSGQLRDQTTIAVSSILNPPLPSTNLYFLSIMRIHQVKYGPFHEHSSQLHSIAVGVPNWRKVNSGLFKMYEAEVIGKRVVVQHIPLGGLLEWEPEASARTMPTITTAGHETQAPWATPPTSDMTRIVSTLHTHRPPSADRRDPTPPVAAPRFPSDHTTTPAPP